MRIVVNAAPTEWVLLIKLDTLPYRSGHASWLSDAMDVIQRHRLFGMTGSFVPDPDQSPLEAGYCVTQKYSNNFSLFRKADWLRVNSDSAGQDSGLRSANSSQFSGENLRYFNEHLIERYCRKRA